MFYFIVSTYPSDPQARMGLTKCMEVLKKMEIVWPSAGRALEILAGSKFNLQESELVKLANHPDRHKRSAEQDLDTEDVGTYQHEDLPSGAADYLGLRPQGYETSRYENGQEDLPNGVDLPSDLPFTDNNSVPYLSSYERWTADGAVAQPFSGPLSTSVLPQLYSTGLVDERAIPGIRVYSNTGGYEPGRRYPQYWNDCTTFPQLGTAYGSMQGHFDQEIQPDSSQASVSPSPMFLPQPYNMYCQSQLHFYLFILV